MGDATKAREVLGWRPRVGFEDLVRIMVDADIAGPEGRLVSIAFVTGVGGQDGSYLAERLLADGVEVHALAHEAEPEPDAPGVVMHTGDLTRIDEVRALVLDLAPDEVYNLAAISSVAQSWAEPELTARVNGTAAGALMESARQAQEKHGKPVRFVQASSAEIFGEPDTSPQDESTADPPGEPVRRCEGLRPPAWSTCTAAGVCTPSARSSTTTSRRAAPRGS